MRREGVKPLVHPFMRFAGAGRPSATMHRCEIRQNTFSLASFPALDITFLGPTHADAHTTPASLAHPFRPHYPRTHARTHARCRPRDAGRTKAGHGWDIPHARAPTRTLLIPTQSRPRFDLVPLGELEASNEALGACVVHGALPRSDAHECRPHVLWHRARGPRHKHAPPPR